MKKLLTTFFLALVAVLPLRAGLQAGGEYYIWLNIYEKLIGTNEAGDGPALSAYGTKGDGYVFVAEASGESGYFLLRQKSSGKYLAASGSNTWSVTLESKSTADRFRWTVTGPDCYAYLTNKKNSSSYVGIDGAKKSADYVSVYYDKRKSSHGQFSVVPANGTWAEARQAYCSGDYTNAQGVNEVDYCQLNDRQVDRSDAVDIHITSNDNPILGSSTVNLGSDRTWLIFDNIIPSQVVSTYLKYVTINGAAAQNGRNCRVAIYLNGAAVIPLPETVMSCDGTAGSFTLAVGNHSDLSQEGQSNTMTSFTLRRGYMATLACGTNGSWYSRVFVADHADLVVTLPDALTKRVSSVNVKPWQYLSKKGWANTAGSSGGPGLRATWYWSWSAGYSSTSDMEYVPCRQHLYWPSAGEVNNKTATAAISINEPDHSEQHTSAKCSCGGTISVDRAFSLNADFQAGGGRIGSPQPQADTDFSYLTSYFSKVDNTGYSRCDIAVIHDYLPISSRSANDYAKYVTDTYWSLWNSTKRPIWLTEMEVGASWNSNSSVINSDDKAREYLQALLQRLEESGYIERYAIYGFDYWRNYMYWDATVSKGLTPAGQVYRDHRSTFAYNADYIKVPTWTQPDAKKPTLAYTADPDSRTITFTVSNPNGDSTEDLLIEYQPEDGDWQTLLTLSDDRNRLESSTVTAALSYDDLDISGGRLRATSTTIYGGSATSDVVAAPVTAVVSGDWTVAEADIIYNGMFATVHEGANYPDGWARTNNWGQMRTGIEGPFATAYYNQPGALQYGNDEQHRLALAANATYRLTFSYRSHELNSNNSVTVSLLNGTDGVKDLVFPGVGSTTEWSTVTADLKTGAAGNYVLTLANSGNTWLTNVSMVRLVEVGDVDGSGTVDAGDVSTLVQHLLGQTSEGFVESAADVDGNNVVDISDVTKLIEKVLSANQ